MNTKSPNITLAFRAE